MCGASAKLVPHDIDLLNSRAGRGFEKLYTVRGRTGMGCREVHVIPQVELEFLLLIDIVVRHSEGHTGRVGVDFWGLVGVGKG